MYLYNNTAINTEIIGKKIYRFNSLPSTNDYIKQLPDIENGTVVIADKQTSGRGRRGHTFFSPEKGIYMTVAYFPTDFCKTAPLITSCTAVAVAKALEKLYETEIKIKWVNDLICGGKKVCGILTESGTDNGGNPDRVFIGIGINIGASKFPDEIKDTATAMEIQSKKRHSIETTIAVILEHLEYELNRINTKEFLEYSRSHSAVIGKEIIVLSDKPYTATAIGIDNSGQLIIDRNGEKTVLNSGEVSIRNT